MIVTFRVSVCSGCRTDEGEVIHTVPSGAARGYCRVGGWGRGLSEKHRSPAAVGRCLYAGQSYEQTRRSDNRGLHRPDGAEWLLLITFPTLKRGANDHCASGATEIGTSLVNKVDSCD